MQRAHLPICTLHICGLALLCIFSQFILFMSIVFFSPLLCADVPPAGPMDLPLSLLEMGCSGRFELITHPMPDQPLPPQSTVSMLQDDCLHLPMYCTILIYLVVFTLYAALYFRSTICHWEIFAILIRFIQQL